MSDEEAGAAEKGPFPEWAFEGVPVDRRPALKAAVESVRETPFGWRHYPHSPTDYLTDLWAVVAARPPIGYAVLSSRHGATWDMWDGAVHHQDVAMGVLRRARAWVDNQVSVDAAQVRLAVLYDATP